MHSGCSRLHHTQLPEAPDAPLECWHTPPPKVTAHAQFVTTMKVQHKTLLSGVPRACMHAHVLGRECRGQQIAVRSLPLRHKKQCGDCVTHNMPAAALDDKQQRILALHHGTDYLGERLAAVHGSRNHLTHMAIKLCVPLQPLLVEPYAIPGGDQEYNIAAAQLL